MANKNPDQTNGSSEEFKDTNIKYVLSKFEYDLYHENDDLTFPVVRVKRIATGKAEKWKLFLNEKLHFTIEGAKLSNKEKEFLRTVDGVNFLIKEVKNGIKSFNAMKNEIKKILTTRKE